MELFFSILILVGGAGGAWLYLRKPPIDHRAKGPKTRRPMAEPGHTSDSPHSDDAKEGEPASEFNHRQVHDLSAERPWRKLGAAIMLLLAVMFVLGIYVLDEHRGVWFYALYWLIIMVLVLWLCVLAIRDVVYTRQLIIRLRDEHERERRRVLEQAARPASKDAS